MSDYTWSGRVRAPREQVFDAIATVDGLRGWWTPIVSGSQVLRFGFEGLSEEIVMRVDGADRPSAVTWTCVRHTGCPEWDGTTLRFDVEEGELRFRHAGVPAELVRRGWDHFLASLVALVERGAGTPFAAV
jgi:hypothetical protein